MDPATPATTPDPSAAAPAVPTTDHVPQTWPGPFGLFKYSKAAVMTNLVTLVVCYVAFLAVSLVLHGVLDGFRDNQISQLINLLLAPFYTIVLYYVLLLDCRGQRVSIGQAFGKLSPMLYLKMLGLMVVMYFIFFVSVLLLVVPFFFIFPRIILAPYYLLDQNLGIVDSLSAAWKGSAGNVGKIWGIIGAAIVMCLPTLTFIGFLATILA